MIEAGEITALLRQFRAGDPTAWDRLSQRTYPELRRIAENHFRDEHQDHLLQPTALVNEVWMKFVALRAVEVNDRIHFFSLCSRLMRQILVDQARRRIVHERALIAIGPGDAAEQNIADLDLALWKLEKVMPRPAQVVELRYFGGMVMEEIADLLGISLATAKRDWLVARAWLYSQLSGASS